MASMHINSESLGESLAAAVAKGEGAGFLESLLGALPPELEGLSPEALLDWLQKQSEQALPFAPLPPMPAPALIETARVPQDPEALLGLLLSSRGELAPAGGQMAGGQMAAAGGQMTGADGLSEAGLLAGLLSGQSGQSGQEAESLSLPLQSLLPAGGSAAAPTATAVAARPALAQDVPSFSLATPVSSPDFSQALGERLVWMVRQDVQHARIHLDPAHLGPLDISVSIKDDVASVVIHAHHATTRDALEADTQRLRAMLGDSGFNAVNVDVARDDSRQPGDAQAGVSTARRLEQEPELGVEFENEARATALGRGLVDHYA